MSRDRLIQLLCFAYNLMVASERLLVEAIAELPEGELRDFYAKHLEDEKDHVKWLADDLGFIPEYDSFAAAIAGTQYYLIKHVDPAALLGYMRVLENQGVTPETVAALEAEHGEKILRTWKYHVVVDKDHLAEIDEMIAKQANRSLIDMNEQRTRQYLEAL